MSQRPYQDCFNAALRLLARRDHSCMELDRKLKQRDFDKAHIQSTITACRRLNYLDDARFAEIYTSQLQRRGYGLRRIRQKLREKGITRQLVSNTLSINCPETKERINCQTALEKKLRSFSQNSNEKISKERLYRFLSGRGFSPAVVRQALEDMQS